MSMVTACPVCATSFLVKPEQLSAHRGDVRCGKCGHVFNALERLGEPPQEIQPVVEIQNTKSPTPASVSDTKLPAKLPSLRKRRGQLWIMATLAVVLLLLAIAQSIYYFRTPIASQWPALKPYLVKACAHIGCSVNLPQDITQLAIDDSDLQEDAEHQGLIKLTTTLINHAPFAQAYPLLELTLTDVDDQPLLRRAFTPAEYLPAGTNIDNGIAPGEEIHIKLALTTTDTVAAGYRVFITFP